MKQWAVVRSAVGAALAAAALAAPAAAQVSTMAGPRNPADTWEAKNGQIVVMTQTQISVSGSEAADITSLRVDTSGTLDESTDIGSLNLCVDTNGNGCWEQGVDVELVTNKTFSQDDGSYTFSGFTRTIAAGGSEMWMVVVHLNGNGSDNEHTRFTVPGGAITATGATSGSTLTATGVATVGGKKTVCTGNGTLTIWPYPVVQPSGCPAGTTHFPMAGLELRASTGAKLDVSALTVTASGTGDDGTDVVQVRLYRDVNADGAIDSGDVELGPGNISYNTDDGTAPFSGLTETIPAGTKLNLLVAYDWAATLIKDTTFTLSLANGSDVTVATNPSGGTTSLNGVPTVHATYTPPCGTDPDPHEPPPGTTTPDPDPPKPREHSPSYCCAAVPAVLGGGGGGAGGLGAGLMLWWPLLLLAALCWIVRDQRRLAAVRQRATRR